MIAIASKIFLNEQLHWTLQAICSACAKETTLPLVMGMTAFCDHCGARIEVDPDTTTFHRTAGLGYAQR